MERWSGKVALVTGASSGIGACIVSKLLQYHIKVIGIARRYEKMLDLFKVPHENGTFIPYKCDLSQESDILYTFELIKQTIGTSTISILVNNAGAAGGHNLLDGTVEEWRKVLDVNVLGVALCTREVLKLIQPNNNYHIIHINSTLGLDKVPPMAINTTIRLGMYPASKHALTSMADVLRAELLLNPIYKNIKVTCIHPGLVSTEMTDQRVYCQKSLKEFFQTAPILAPTPIAEAVVYVLSTAPNVQVDELVIRPIGDNYL